LAGKRAELRSFCTATRLNILAQGWLRQRPTLGNVPKCIVYAESVIQTPT
jgi:hypothetical protein